MKSYWKIKLNTALNLELGGDFDVKDLLVNDFLKINRFSKRENSHLVWSGMLTSKGEPRFKSNYLMMLYSTKNRPYHVKQFLYSVLGHDVKKKTIKSICGNKLCIKLEHLQVCDERFYLTRSSIQQLIQLSSIYPISYLSSFYDIEPRTLKKYIHKFKQEKNNDLDPIMAGRV